VRRIAILAFEGAQTLDVTGPFEVFAMANRLSGGDAYEVEIVAPEVRTLRTGSGLAIVPDRATSGLRGPLDTLVIAGGEGVLRAVGDERLLRWVKRTAGRARRVASVCTGAYLLAEAGLLDGRRAATHWASAADLARRFPEVEVDPEAIFVRDGDVWTSAGVTAGMDLALALVEEDLGRDVALGVARRLVLFLRRPANQSQFSAQLSAQVADHDALRDVQAWIAEHPEGDLSVAGLARRAVMSERNFARCFRAQVGLTPARYVEQVRIEAARRRLEETDDSVDTVARECGFGTAETLRRTFLRTLRTTPTEYRRRFCAA
jgi:transcriptional regulator GlxA family with amidase domain